MFNYNEFMAEYSMLNNEEGYYEKLIKKEFPNITLEQDLKLKVHHIHANIELVPDDLPNINYINEENYQKCNYAYSEDSTEDNIKYFKSYNSEEIFILIIRQPDRDDDISVNSLFLIEVNNITGTYKQILEFMNKLEDENEIYI